MCVCVCVCQYGRLVSSMSRNILRNIVDTITSTFDALTILLRFCTESACDIITLSDLKIHNWEHSFFQRLEHRELSRLSTHYSITKHLQVSK